MSMGTALLSDPRKSFTYMVNYQRMMALLPVWFVFSDRKIMLVYLCLLRARLVQFWHLHGVKLTGLAV